jgi:hypothetical protein
VSQVAIGVSLFPVDELLLTLAGLATMMRPRTILTLYAVVPKVNKVVKPSLALMYIL